MFGSKYFSVYILFLTALELAATHDNKPPDFPGWYKSNQLQSQGNSYIPCEPQICHYSKKKDLSIDSPYLSRQFLSYSNEKFPIQAIKSGKESGFFDHAPYEKINRDERSTSMEKEDKLGSMNKTSDEQQNLFTKIKELEREATAYDENIKTNIVLMSRLFDTQSDNNQEGLSRSGILNLLDPFHLAEPTLKAVRKIFQTFKEFKEDILKNISKPSKPESESEEKPVIIEQDSTIKPTESHLPPVTTEVEETTTTTI